MIGKKITTTNIIESKCEYLNDQQIKIYSDQIKLVDQKMCKICKNEFWEMLDLSLRDFYYDQVNLEEDEKLYPFEIDLFNNDLICIECLENWELYISMDHQRYRLDLKKIKCYEKLKMSENNQRIWDKYTL